jgi:hypothetical protein
LLQHAIFEVSVVEWIWGFAHHVAAGSETRYKNDD